MNQKYKSHIWETKVTVSITHKYITMSIIFNFKNIVIINWMKYYETLNDRSKFKKETTFFSKTNFVTSIYPLFHEVIPILQVRREHDNQ